MTYGFNAYLFSLPENDLSTSRTVLFKAYLRPYLISVLFIDKGSCFVRFIVIGA